MKSTQLMLAILFLVGGLAGLGYRTWQPLTLIAQAAEADDPQAGVQVAAGEGVLAAVTLLLTDDAVGETRTVFLPAVKR